MRKIKLRGYGQLNGVVIINKELELEDNVAQSFFGGKREDVITATLAVHYPGVIINPRQISVQNIEIKKKNKGNQKSKSIFEGKLIFLPFRITWKLLKWLTND